MGDGSPPQRGPAAEPGWGLSQRNMLNIRLNDALQHAQIVTKSIVPHSSEYNYSLKKITSTTVGGHVPVTIRPTMIDAQTRKNEQKYRSASLTYVDGRCVLWNSV